MSLGPIKKGYERVCAWARSLERSWSGSPESLTKANTNVAGSERRQHDMQSSHCRRYRRLFVLQDRNAIRVEQKKVGAKEEWSKMNEPLNTLDHGTLSGGRCCIRIY